MIAGQATLLGRTMHDIRHDSIHDEIVVPNPFAQAILTFRGNAEGEAPPIRVIQGSKTQMKSPDRVAIDPVHNEIYVPNGDSVLVFPRETSGDVAPSRVLRGSNTGLRGAMTVAVDSVNNVVVAPGVFGRERTPALLIFKRTDQGNVAPQRAILEASSGQQMEIYSPRGWIVTLPGGDMATRIPSINIWNIHDNGKVPPRWTIKGPKNTLLRPRGIALNPKNKEIIVADMTLNSVLTYYFPEMF